MDMLKNLKDRFFVLSAQKRLLEQQAQTAERRSTEAESRMESAMKAKAVLQLAATKTQEQLEFKLSALVTTALSSVFPDPYTFKVKFIERRGKTECDLLFERKGNEVEPTEGSGGGTVDVASFALRLAFWSLKKGRAILIMDEPFKFVSENYQEECAEMLKSISEKLSVQIIMVSHIPKLIGNADKVFTLSSEAS